MSLLGAYPFLRTAAEQSQIGKPHVSFTLHASTKSGAFYRC